MRYSYIAALAALSFAYAATPAAATTEVRDHRTPPVVRDHRDQPEVRDHRTQPEVRDHRTQPEVRDHRAQPEVRDHRGEADARDHRDDDKPHEKTKRACLLGVVCTSNKTVVGIADKVTPHPINLD